MSNNLEFCVVQPSGSELRFGPCPNTQTYHDLTISLEWQPSFTFVSVIELQEVSPLTLSVEWQPSFPFAPAISLVAKTFHDLTVATQWQPSFTFTPAIIVAAVDVGLTINAEWQPSFIVTAAITSEYDSNVWRGIVSATTTPWSRSTSIGNTKRCDYSQSFTAASARRLTSTGQNPVSERHSIAYFEPHKTASPKVVRYTDGIKVSKRKGATWTYGIPVPSPKIIWTTEPLRLNKRVSNTNVNSIRVHDGIDNLYTTAAPVGRQQDFIYNFVRVATRKLSHLVYTHGSPLTPGRHWLVPALQPKTLQPVTGNNGLVFCGNSWQPLEQNELRFGSQLCVPVTKRIYVVSNSFSMVRVDNSVPIFCESFTLSIDSGSWSYSWAAKTPGNSLADVLAANSLQPVEVLATINGQAFKLVIEKISRDRSFGSSSISIGGRGLSAYLGAPYAPITTLYSQPAITAQQAANQALTYNAVPIGWTVDYQLEDWLIAPEALSNTGTYIDHLTRIAEAGGGYVQPHPTDDVMRILPYYPVAPWLLNQETPDVILSDDPVVTESIEWTTKADYNAVWINGGSSGGRLDLIKKTGTAGDYQAPTVVDNLATDAIMTRQRGIRVLGDTGRILSIKLSLPVLDTSGIIIPGTVIQYVTGVVERMGIVRSTSVTVGFPVVRQSIEVETYEHI